VFRRERVRHEARARLLGQTDIATRDAGTAYADFADLAMRDRTQRVVEQVHAVTRTARPIVTFFLGDRSS